jgi:hypothetical protein
MHGHVPVPLLESVVFLYIMQIITSDDNSSLHFHLLNHASQDPASNGHVARKRTFLVDVSSINRLSWCLESKSDWFVMTELRFSLLVGKYFTIQVDDLLLLKGTLSLIRHGCIFTISTKLIDQIADE